MLEQLAFHSAYPANFSQALNTCNVTHLGICFANESPSQIAKVIAEVGITGSFRTADGSIITPRKADIQTALRDQSFPPHPTDPIATGVSRAFAVTAANISWQRRTADEGSIPVAKGSLYYAQEGGEGVFFDQNGQKYYSNGFPDSNGIRSPIKDDPGIRVENIVDIGEQISGVPWKNKVLVSSNIHTGTTASWAGAAEQHKRLVPISNIEELHKALLVEHTQIAQVHTTKPPFYYDSGYGQEPGAGGLAGGWHVVTKTKYEPAYDAYGRLDPQKSLVYIDNSWPTRLDHLTRERAIPLAQLYNAMNQ